MQRVRARLTAVRGRDAIERRQAYLAAFLEKPFSTQGLGTAIERVLGPTAGPNGVPGDEAT